MPTLFYIHVILIILASLSRRCIGTGIIFAYAITLCQDDNIRVVSGSLSVVSRLLGIIIWGYILRMRGGPLMVIVVND